MKFEKNLMLQLDLTSNIKPIISLFLCQHTFWLCSILWHCDIPWEESNFKRCWDPQFKRLLKYLLSEVSLEPWKTHSVLFLCLSWFVSRRESERRNHSLARHADILAAVETRLSLLNMTFMKYVDSNLCCFIPGKVSLASSGPHQPMSGRKAMIFFLWVQHQVHLNYSFIFSYTQSVDTKSKAKWKMILYLVFQVFERSYKVMISILFMV